MKHPLIACCLMAAACGQASDQLVPAQLIEGDGIPAPLTRTPGNIDRGLQVFVDRDQGHCVLCHEIRELNTPFQGNVGPDLSTVGDRLSPAQIRLRIVDYQIVRPGTLMPSYYRTHDLYQVGAAYADAPILTAQQVEDLVTYLSAQKDEEYGE